MNFSEARHWMVEAQARTADVTDPLLVSALRRLPREAFAPAGRESLAYADLELEVAPGRTLMRPRDIAKLLQALEIKPGEKVLEIAGATGYGAAVAAAIGAKVVALESNPELGRAAQAAFERAGVASIVSAITPTIEGWLDAAPYDAIFLNGSAEFVPDAWVQQLAEGGRLGVIVRNGPAGSARLYVRTGGTTAYRTIFDAAPPVAPGLAQAAQFRF
jgi:protein-L-isoaspartate(D-aspartate) O-methyltransferase